MKRQLITAAVLCCFMALAPSAWALSISDVGSIDSLLASGTMAQVGSSGDADVIAWVESILGGTWEISANNGSVAGDWESIEGMAGVFAFLLEGNPEYFLVKTGNVADPDIRFFLFRNLADLAYAVLDLGLLDFNDILNVAGISHVTEFGYDGGGGPPPVPEPGTMMLLGSGLIGLAGWGRKRFGKHVA